MEIDEAVRLRRAVVQLARALNVTALESGLTPTQASVLGIIAVRGPLPVAEVARVERLNPSMTSRTVAALHERGLVKRSLDPSDRRAAVLEITAAGRRLHTQVRAERASIMQRAAGRLSPQDHRRLVDALGSLETLAGLTD